MRKLKLIGIRNLPLLEDIRIDPNKEYLICHRASLEGTYLSEKHTDEIPDEVYHLRATQVELVKEIGSKKEIKVEKGKSPSQILKFMIEEWLRLSGKDDSYENYQREIKKLVGYYSDKIEKLKQ